jgi:hypothetical protein
MAPGPITVTTTLAIALLGGFIFEKKQVKPIPSFAEASKWEEMVSTAEKHWHIAAVCLILDLIFFSYCFFPRGKKMVEQTGELLEEVKEGVGKAIHKVEEKFEEVVEAGKEGVGKAVHKVEEKLEEVVEAGKEISKELSKELSKDLSGVMHKVGSQGSVVKETAKEAETNAAAS